MDRFAVSRRLLASFVLAGSSAAAEPRAPAPVDWDGAMLVGELRAAAEGAPSFVFAPGEEMVFEIRPEGVAGDIPPDAYFVDWERRGDDGIAERGRAPLPTADAPLVIRTKSDRPGFVCVEANVVTADGRRVPRNHRWEKRVFFQGGAAVAPDALRPGTEPADYDEFWDAQMARLAAVPVAAELAPTPCADPGVRLYAVRIDCAGPRPVTGWLTMPAEASPTNRYPLEVSYRGASHDDQPAPARGPHDRIRFESNGHGFDLGKGPDYARSFFAGVCRPGYEYGFDPESNERRETSYWLGMALRAVRTLQWAVVLPEWDGTTLGLAVQSVHAPWGRAADLWCADEAKGEAAVAELVDCLRASAEIGAPFVVAHAWIGFVPTAPTEDGLRRFARVADEAERLGVPVALENTEGEEHLDALLARFEGHPAVGFCWDTGHELCYNRGRDLMAPYGARLLGTHLNDNLGISDPSGPTTWLDDLHLLPFDGVADWPGIASRLARSGFAGPLAFELNRSSKPNRHENDAYGAMPLRDYLAEALARARRVAGLVAAAAG